MAQKVECRVGGWTMLAVPGTPYTFGDGNTTWGPYSLEEVAELEELIGYHAWEGLAVAEPICNERPCQCGSGEPWVSCSAADPCCG